MAAGKSVTDPNQYGDWIADIERPAEQYRGRYGERLGEAQDLLKSAPAPSAGAAPVDVATPGGSSGAAGAAVDAAGLGTTGAAGPQAMAAVKEAEKYLGTSYHWGGSTPQTGFDCSGLMQWAYAKAGIQIPRVTYTQIADPQGIPVDRDHLRPGDLIFFADHGDVHHVAMSLGGDKFIHAPHTGDVVKVSSLDDPYYKSQFDGGRRFDQSVPVEAASTPAAAPVAPVAPAAAPPVDPMQVAKAQAAVARDAAEVGRHNSLLFKAVSAQEASKAKATLQFMKAIDPKQQIKPADVPAPAPVASAAGAPVAPVPPEAATTPPVDPSASRSAADLGPSPDLSAVDLADYPGDHAPKDEIAKWMAKQAEKAGLPPELPVMASLVESGVNNVHYGDADSVGFFQMRVGIWDRGPYAGFQDNPRLQVKWFIDNALNVKKQRIAAGKPIDDPGQFGEWIADVERPAAQYRYRYQLRLSEARRLLS
jgi:cell wall-associated NlpC family hydrolase